MIDTQLKKKEFVDLFSSIQEDSLMVEKKDEIIDLIKHTDFPSRSTEAWKNTSLNNILKHSYTLGNITQIPDEYINTFSFYQLETNRIVFINGHFSEQYSSVIDNKDGLIIGSLKKAANNESIKNNLGKTKLHKNNLFTAINSAYATDGACIIIPDNYVPENPIHIVNFVNGDNAKIISQSRNLIYLGKNAQAKVINTYHSLSSDFTFNNVGTEIFTEEDANLHYYVFQGEGNEASQINNTFVEQNKGSFFTMNTSTLCGSTVRNEIHVDFKDEHCEADLQGIYLPDKEQHVDNYVSILHSKPNCNSSQLYKGIIDNKAKSVFTGKVYVARDAQKTDAAQSNKNLLLTDTAKAYSRPQLEIYADDVSCAHGSTTGQIDKEELFYLKSRGIPERRAKTMLMTAFIEDVLNKIEIKQYKEYVQFLVNRRLKGQEVEGLCSVKICPNC